ncbi:MAG: LamG domain-containing protein [Mangrovibacterium sp.]
MKLFLPLMAFALISFYSCSNINKKADAEPAGPEAVSWNLIDLMGSTTGKVSVSGVPQVVESPYGPAIAFDGQDDGIFLDEMPLKGLTQFTIEIIFRPESQGNFEQRFFHCGEANADRVLLETRSTATHWYFDAYLQSGTEKLALIDSTLLHPLDQWYHAAFVVDNGHLTTYINQEKELEGSVNSGPINTGQSSFGVRLDKRSWFKGAIYQVKISPQVLKPEDFINL